MSGPFRKTTSIADVHFSPGEDNDTILSVEILPDSLSLAVMDASRFRYVALEHYEKEKSSPSDIVDYDELKTLIKDIPRLHLSYKKIYVAYYSQQLILLPGEISSFDDQKALLQYTCKLPDNHAVKSDRLNNLNAFGVYSYPDWLMHLLESYIPFFRLRHAGSILIESIMSTIQIDEVQTDIVLQLRKSSFDVMIMNGVQLKLFQIFSYHQFDDLLYVLFYLIKQFHFNAASTRLMLCGNISLDSEQYTRLVSYFGQVFFARRNDAYTYVEAFDNLPHHYFYTLINMNACG